MSRVRHRIQVVNNLETGFVAEIVDARDVDQIIERKFVTAELCDFAKIARRNLVSRFTAEFNRILNFLAKCLVHRNEQFLTSHDSAASNRSTSSGFCFLNERSREIF